MPGTSDKKRLKIGCLITALSVFTLIILVVAGGVFATKKAFTDFDSRRDQMALRAGLVVADENIRYSPGMDAAMWSRFTVTAKTIDEVFDSSKIDTKEFSKADYDFHAGTIGDSWWDADRHKLIGGEVYFGGDFMRVGYRDNGDGTLTVYIYWFEV